MQGPFRLSDINTIPIESLPGVYILSCDGQYAHYVGRSDVAIGARLKQHAQSDAGYQYFWFEYTDPLQPQQAYLKECELYHKYNPPDNKYHPAVLPGAFWRCPVCGV